MPPPPLPQAPQKPRTFQGDPNPPAGEVDAKSDAGAQPAASSTGTSGGTGALPPAKPKGVDGKDIMPGGSAAENSNFSVIERGDGSRDVFMSDSNGDTNLGRINSPDAEKILSAAGKFNPATKTWDGVPFDTVKSLLSGRQGFPEQVMNAWRGGEAGVVRGLLGAKVMYGEMDGVEAKQQGEPFLLKERLSQDPAVAWKDGEFTDHILDYFKHPVDTGEKAVVGLAGMAPGLKDVLLHGTIPGATQGVAGGLAAAGVASLASGPLAPEAAAAAVSSAMSLGASYGTYKRAMDLMGGGFAMDMLDKGYDDKAVRIYAPIVGAVDGALTLMQFDLMTPAMKAKAISTVLGSDTVKASIAKWLGNYAQHVAGFAGLGTAQEATNLFVGNMAAAVEQKPDMVTGPDVGRRLLETGMQMTMAGMVAGVPGAAVEGLRMRANTAAETKAAGELTKTLADREAAKPVPGEETPSALPSEAKVETPGPEETAQAGGEAGDAKKTIPNANAELTPAQQMDELLGPGSKAKPEDVVEGAAKAMTAEERAADKLGPAATAARLRELKSNLTDVSKTIDDLSNVRESNVKAGAPTRALDTQIRDLLAQEASLEQDVKFYSDPKNAEVATGGKGDLKFTHATLRDVLEMGFKEGGKQSQERARELTAIAKENGLSVTDVRKLIGNKAIGAMGDVQYHNFLEGFERERDQPDGMRRLYRGEGGPGRADKSFAGRWFTDDKKEALKYSKGDPSKVKIIDIAPADIVTTANPARDTIPGKVNLVPGERYIVPTEMAANAQPMNEHTPGFREGVAKLVERKAALRDLVAVQKERAIAKEQYVRQLNKLPSVHKMTTEQIKNYAEILKTYDKGDEALSPKRVEALKGTVLDGVKTLGEARKAAVKLTGRPLEDFQNVKVPLRAAAIPDPQLRSWYPALRPLIDLSHQMTEKGKALADTARSRLMELAATAIKERRDTLPLAARVADYLAPQQKELMDYIEATDPANVAANPKEVAELAAKLTPGEKAWADFWQAWAGEARGYLEKKEGLDSRFAADYVPHAPRDWAETLRDIKDVGLWKTLKDFLPDGDSVDFADKRGNVLGFNKFLKQTLFRSGELIPSKNMAQVMGRYMEDFYNKVTQDEIAPVLDTLARSMRPEDEDPKAAKAMSSAIEEFTKLYANNKKGINASGGIVGALAEPALRLSRTLAAIHYIEAYYALQATVATVKMLPGEFMALGGDLAKAKQLKYTDQGKLILEKYSAFVGKGAFETATEPGRGLKDWVEGVGHGIFTFAHQTAMEDILLGSMTKEEFKAGEISNARLAEIRLNAGRWMDMEGMSSIAGSSETGRTATQFKRWAVPPVLTLSELAGALRDKVSSGKPLTEQQGKELLRLGVLAAAAATAGTVLTKDMEDDTFVGRAIHYIRMDLHTMWRGLDPAFFLTVPVGPGYVFKLASDLHLLATLEEYKKKDGLKGADALRRDLTPAMMKQLPGGEGEK